MKRYPWLLPVLLAAIVYAQAPWGELVWDDHYIARQLLGFSSFGDVLFPPEGLVGWTYAYYRPVVLLSYLLDARLFGSAATSGPHIANLLYHVVTTFFVWLLAWRLFHSEKNSRLGALLAATIFAVHPIHAESVYWIAARSDVLATLFLLPSVILVMRWRDAGQLWHLALAGLIYLLALLSKEVAIAALVIVPATLILKQRNNSPDGGRTTFQRWAALVGLYLSVTGLYLILRSSAAAVDGTGGTWLNVAEAFQNAVRAGAYYLGKVLVPWPQSNIVVWEMVPGLAISLFILLAGLALLLMAIWWWRRRDVGIPLLGAIWFAATLAPSFVLTISDFSGGSEIVAVGKFPVAERYLYLPSVGLALIFGWLFCGLFSTRWRKQANWAAIAVVVVLSATTIYRGYIWSNNLRLWSDTTSKVTTHGPPWNELGRAYLEQGDDENALQSFRHALTLKNSSPERATIGHNIGTIYLRRQNLAQAETHFTAAIEAKPTFAESHYGLGLAYAARVGQALADGDSNAMIKNRMNLAVSHFAAAIRINPDFHLARLLSARIQADYGQLLEREGSQQQATVAYRSARAQIDAVVAGIPESVRQQYVDDWSGEVNVDLYQLSTRIDGNLQRIGD